MGTDRIKILALGNFEVHSYAPFWQGLKMGFEDYGWDFEGYDIRNHANFDEVRAKVDEVNPDILLLCTYDPINKGWVKNLTGRWLLAFWYCDISVPNKGFARKNTYSPQPIDMMFVSNREQIDFWKTTFNIDEVYFMPQACLPTEWVNNGEERKVIFIGGKDHPIHARRQKILDEIGNRQTIEYLPRDDYTEPEVYKNLKKILRGAKITLGLSAFNDVDLYTSDRLFLTTGNCGFYLCEYFKGIEDIYRPGHHLVAFQDVKDALDKIDFYLRHDTIRERIRREGFELAQDRHTYINRIRNVADIMTGKTKDFYGYL